MGQNKAGAPTVARAHGLRVEAVKGVDARAGRVVALGNIHALVDVGNEDHAVAHVGSRPRSPALLLARRVALGQCKCGLARWKGAWKAPKGHGLHLDVERSDGAGGAEHHAIVTHNCTKERQVGRTHGVGEGHGPARQRRHEGVQQRGGLAVAGKRGCRGLWRLLAVGEEGVLVGPQSQACPVEQDVRANGPLHVGQIAYRHVVWAAPDVGGGLSGGGGGDGGDERERDAACRGLDRVCCCCALPFVLV